MKQVKSVFGKKRDTFWSGGWWGLTKTFHFYFASSHKIGVSNYSFCHKFHCYPLIFCSLPCNTALFPNLSHSPRRRERAEGRWFDETRGWTSLMITHAGGRGWRRGVQEVNWSMRQEIVGRWSWQLAREGHTGFTVQILLQLALW